MSRRKIGRKIGRKIDRKIGRKIGRRTQQLDAACSVLVRSVALASTLLQYVALLQYCAICYTRERGFEAS